MPFRDVTGHHRLLALLARSIAHESLPPSLILSGPSGVGKRLTANAIAQALNCLAPIRSTDKDSKTLEFDACGECAACKRIARGVHPDVLVAEPGDSGSIKTDSVRALIDATGYRPFEGRRRVIIIDDADALVVNAQHALLKSLEEPPPSSVFLLVTSRPDMLLPTVQSRCPRLRFQLVESLAANTDDQVAARDIAVRVLAQTAENPDAARRSATSQALGGAAGSNAVGRDDLAAVLRAMSSLVRDIGALGTGAKPSTLANPDLAPALGRLSAFQGDRGVRAFSAIDQALVALDRNASVKIVADWVVLQL